MVSHLMSNLLEIVKQELNIQFIRLRDELDGEIEAMRRLLAANGKIGAGEHMVKTLEICDGKFQRLRDFINKKAEWLSSQSLSFTKQDANLFISCTKNTFNEMYGIADSHLKKSAELNKKPGIYGYCLPKLTASMKNSLDEAVLFSESQVLVKRNKGIRGAISVVLGIISRLVKGA